MAYYWRPLIQLRESLEIFTNVIFAAAENISFCERIIVYLCDAKKKTIK